jgi:hypothetical protein
MKIWHAGLSGPYFLDRTDVAGPLSINEVRGPVTSSFANAKIKYLHGTVRQNLAWDMQAIERFGTNFKSYVTVYEGTNGAGRDTFAKKWIEENRTVSGQSVLTSISLPIYQFINWHSKSFVIYDHFKTFVPAWVNRNYTYRDLNVFRLDPNDPTKYNASRSSSIRVYY